MKLRINESSMSGKTFTYKRDTSRLWYGVPNCYFIWFNSQQDPYVEYDGKIYDTVDVENSLWEYYKEICDEDGVEATTDGFEDWVDEDLILNELYNLEPIAVVET